MKPERIQKRTSNPQKPTNETRAKDFTAKDIAPNLTRRFRFRRIEHATLFMSSVSLAAARHSQTALRLALRLDKGKPIVTTDLHRGDTRHTVEADLAFVQVIDAAGVLYAEEVA